MTQALPRIGCDNLLHDNRSWLRASTEQSTFGVSNLARWRGGRYWKPTFAANPPATAYVYCYPLTVANRIDLANWYMGDWTAGASAAPDNWTLAGAGASVARNSTAGQFKIDQYSAALTRSGTDCTLLQTVPDYSKYPGLRVTFGAYVHCATADRARLVIDDGVGQTHSAYNDGDNDLDWQTVTREIVYNATQLKVGLQVDTGNATASIDGVCLYKGTTATATPHAKAVDYLAIFDHNLYSAGQVLTLEYSDDSASWASPTTHLTLTATSDRAAWVDTQSPVTKAAWRMAFTGATGSQGAEVACASFGDYIELVDYLEEGFDPYYRQLRSELPKTRDGYPLGRGVRMSPVRLRCSIPWQAESFLTGDMKTWWEHGGDGAIPGGKPFFLQWDDGDHGSQTFFAWFAESAKLSAPLYGGMRAKRIEFDIEGVAE